jgi:FkbM family methyltransferase
MFPLKTPFSERTYRVNGSTNDRSVIAALVATGGYWEPHLMSIMKSRLPSNAICMDIGANIGIMTLIMGDLCSDGGVFAVEPSSRNLVFLKENLQFNQISNVTVLQYALWDRPCDMDLFYIDELAACAFLEPNRTHESGIRKIKAVVTQPWLATVTLHHQSETVSCVRLDDLAVSIDLKRLDFIKLDAEGAENAVLRGGLHTLHRYHPALIAEFNPACMTRYFDRDPTDYYNLLASIYPNISLIESTGELTPVVEYALLQERIVTGKGWEDIFCCF